MFNYVLKKSFIQSAKLLKVLQWLLIFLNLFRDFYRIIINDRWNDIFSSEFLQHFPHLILIQLKSIFHLCNIRPNRSLYFNICGKLIKMNVKGKMKPLFHIYANSSSIGCFDTHQYWKNFNYEIEWKLLKIFTFSHNHLLTVKDALAL